MKRNSSQFLFAVLLGEIGEVDNVAYNSTFAYSMYGTFDTNRPSHIVVWPKFNFQNGSCPPS